MMIYATLSCYISANSLVHICSPYILLFISFVVISSGRRLEQLVGGGNQKNRTIFFGIRFHDEMKMTDVSKHLLGFTPRSKSSTYITSVSCTI